MVKTIWAVACTIVAVWSFVSVGGCASTKSQMADFSRMDIGEGPGATLRRLTELQKDTGSPHAATTPDKKIPAPSSSRTSSSSDTLTPPSSDLANAAENKPKKPTNENPPTKIARKTSPQEKMTRPQKGETSSKSEVSKESTKPSSAGITSSKPTNSTDISPTNPPEPARKEVPKSDFLSQLDEVVKNRTNATPQASASAAITAELPVQEVKQVQVQDTKPAEKLSPPSSPSISIQPMENITKNSTNTSVSASPSGAMTGEVHTTDVKQAQEAKPAENPIPSPSSSKPLPPSENPEPPEKEVSRHASAGRIPSAVPPTSPAAGRGTTSSDPQYRIGPEDVLHVSVWGNEQLTMDVIVRPDGKISIPLLQDVQAEGLTADELAGAIHEKLLAYIKDPNVSVIVKEINAAKISVIGYVVRPGTFPLRGDLTVLQALSQAGGFTPFASPRKIKLIRKTDGKTEVRVINYYDMISRGGVGDYLLKAGDTIVVP